MEFFLFSERVVSGTPLTQRGICTSSSAHRRFQEWRDAGVFERFWQNGLIYEGVDWRSISMDGCQTKAPLAGSKNW